MENRITILFEKGQINPDTFLLFQIRNSWDDILHAWQIAVGTKKLLFSSVFSIHIIIISLTADICLCQYTSYRYYTKNVWSDKPARTAATAHAMLENRFYILLPCWVARDAEHLCSICSRGFLTTNSTDQAEDTFPSPSLPRYSGFCCRWVLWMHIVLWFLTVNLKLHQEKCVQHFSVRNCLTC